VEKIEILCPETLNDRVDKLSKGDFFLRAVNKIFELANFVLGFHDANHGNESRIEIGRLLHLHFERWNSEREKRIHSPLLCLAIETDRKLLRFVSKLDEVELDFVLVAESSSDFHKFVQDRVGVELPSHRRHSLALADSSGEIIEATA